MKNGIYSKMAWTNLKKNYRFFIPRILTQAGLLGCFYIVFSLSIDDRMQQAEGGTYIPIFMAIGTIVIGLLSCILMLYTNSFLMKQRRSEFGLYNILGLEKRHVGRILFFESFLSFLCAMILGLMFGCGFYYLSTIVICKLLKVESVVSQFTVSVAAVAISLSFFILLEAFTYIINRIKIAKQKPVELLQSRHSGEREPKVKWPLFVIGFICLVAGYAISINVKSPLAAILLFFVAVILVIIGTYFLFVAGSIAVLKGMKNNTKYYYDKKHMTSVSGLLYRMKQNAVGLASIAILATGVLVMISTTVSLYIGSETTVKQNFPDDQYIYAEYYTKDGATRSVPAENLADAVKSTAEDFEIGIESVAIQRYLEVAYVKEGSILKSEYTDDIQVSDITSMQYIAESEYTRLTGETLNLNDNEMAICPMTVSAKRHFNDTSITVHGKEYTISKVLEFFPISSRLSSTVDNYGVVVSDEVLEEIYQGQLKDYGENASSYVECVCVNYVNLNDAEENSLSIDNAVSRCAADYAHSQPDYDEDEGYMYHSQCVWNSRNNLLGMYGTLLFLGIILGFVCMFATVLIIYYKQISEGYEDRERFVIMEKIGMSQQEIKATIKSQILWVFFLPLIVAIIHVGFAFPILSKLLHVLLLSSNWLFIGCTAVSFLVFALVYYLIFRQTAKTYYKIVR